MCFYTPSAYAMTIVANMSYYAKWIAIAIAIVSIAAYMQPTDIATLRDKVLFAVIRLRFQKQDIWSYESFFLFFINFFLNLCFERETRNSGFLLLLWFVDMHTVHLHFIGVIGMVSRPTPKYR